MPKKGVKKYKCVLYFEIVYCAAGAFYVYVIRLLDMLA